MTDGPARGASVISSLSSYPTLGDTIQFRPNLKQNYWPDMSEFGVAARMPGREQTEGLGFKERAVKTLPALAGNLCL
jgi:hypothetical protein